MTPVQVANVPLTTCSSADTVDSKRSSNSAEDAVHQHAQLVLHMAMSLESSNQRRRRQLQQIESGKMHHVQQVIDEIMQEQPASVMSVLQELDPELLPSAAELKERYRSQKGGSGPASETDDDDNEDSNERSDASDDEFAQQEKKTVDTTPERKKRDQEFRKEQDQIIALAQVPASLPTNIDPSTLQAHTAPLQEQLKHSYEAIVRLRENADLRYEALEEKYNALKREKQVEGKAQQALAQKAGLSPVDLNNIGNEPMKEQLTQAYEALIRLRENSELRYSVLESKFLDLKRSHTEADARTERLEQELEKTRLQLKRARQHNAQLFQDSQKKSSSATVSTVEIQKDTKKAKKLLVLFQGLYQKVSDCEQCKSNVPAALKKKIEKHLAKIEEQLTIAGENTDTDSDSEDDELQDAIGSDITSSLSSARRHDGAMALLGANWETISKIEVSDKELAAGKFANVSESKSEQKLRGKASQFVACQSGVYCRIDHDMNQYGSLKDRYQKTQAPRSLPPPPAAVPPPPPQSNPVPAIRSSAIKPTVKKQLPSLEEVDKEDRSMGESMKRTPEFVEVPEKPLTASEESGLTISTIEESGLAAFTAEDLEQPPPLPLAEESQQPQPAARSPAPALTSRKSSRNKPSLGKKSVSFANRFSVTTIEDNHQSEASTETAPGEEQEERAKEEPQGKQAPLRHLIVPSAPGERQQDGEDSRSREKHEDNEAPMELTGAGHSRSSQDPDKDDHRDMDSSAVSLGSRTPRIPPAKLDAAERKAKRLQALKDAKKTARSVRKENKSRSRNGGDDGASLASGFSSTSSLATNRTGSSQNSKRGFFLNPFKLKNKSLETAAGRTADIPSVVGQDAGLTSKVKETPTAGAAVRSAVARSKSAGRNGAVEV